MQSHLGRAMRVATIALSCLSAGSICSASAEAQKPRTDARQPIASPTANGRVDPAQDRQSAIRMAAEAVQAAAEASRRDQDPSLNGTPGARALTVGASTPVAKR